MDVTTVLVMFVGGLIAIGLTAYMLNRAWGDLPGRIGPPDRGPSPLPPSSSPAWGAAPADDDEGDEEERGDTPLPAGAPEDSLIPVTHPMVSRAIEAALERGGSPYATYFLRDGERLFLAAHRIADPVQRAQFVRVFKELNGGDPSGASISEIVSVIQQLAKRP